MELFLNLYLGHLVGDFVLQPGRLVRAKREGAPGLVLHTLVVGACTVLAVAGPRFSTQWPAALLVTGLHLVIEQLTIITYLRTPTRGLFTFLFDQTLHTLSIATVTWLSTGALALAELIPPRSAVLYSFGLPIVARPGSPGGALGMLALICALGTVTLFGSILVFETSNAALEGNASKGRLLRFDAARFGGIVERGVALLLAAWWTPAALLAAFAPRIAWGLTRAPEDRARALVEAGAGALLCISAWAAIALIVWLSGPGRPI
jgi:hypothetical protein